MKKFIELKPVKETSQDYEHVEKRIKELFKREIYLPILKMLGHSQITLTNSRDDLLKAIKFGQIQFYRGQFTGRLNAKISKELKALGARWDAKTRTFRLPQSSLPPEVHIAITASRSHFEQKLAGIDRKLAQILPVEIADKLKVDQLFDQTLWRVERDFNATLKGITVAPELTKEQRSRIAKEWQTNMKLYIKDWTKKEIIELRKNMQESVFSGNRYETAIKTIKKSYGVSETKAKFLARQETGLLMAKFKESRYVETGIKKYIWKCVTGTEAHPVRKTHKECDNKIFTWDNPNELGKDGRPNPNGQHKPGANKNPGEDYNCRCYAKPIVEFGRIRE